MAANWIVLPTTFTSDDDDHHAIEYVDSNSITFISRVLEEGGGRYKISIDVNGSTRTATFSDYTSAETWQKMMYGLLGIPV